MKTVNEFKDLLCTFPWFKNTGTLIDDKCVSAVSTWSQAREFACCSNRWINFKWSIARHMYGQIEPKKLDQHEEIKALRRMLARFTTRKFVKDLDQYIPPGSAATSRSTSGHLAYHVRFDLWIAGHEYILGDKIKPLFFRPVILDWYSKGHFPCGWHGTMIKSNWNGKSLKDLPPGRLRVL